MSMCTFYYTYRCEEPAEYWVELEHDCPEYAGGATTKTYQMCAGHTAWVRSTPGHCVVCGAVVPVSRVTSLA